MRPARMNSYRINDPGRGLTVNLYLDLGSQYCNPQTHHAAPARRSGAPDQDGRFTIDALGKFIALTGRVVELIEVSTAFAAKKETGARVFEAQIRLDIYGHVKIACTGIAPKPNHRIGCVNG